MTRLQYKHDHPKYVYDILQVKKGAPYQFLANGTLIGSVEKVDGKWQQTSGRQTLDSIVAGIGALIDKNV